MTSTKPTEDSLSVLEMYQKMLSHPKVKANPGAKQYIQDQIELVQKRLPSTEEAEATSTANTSPTKS